MHNAEHFDFETRSLLNSTSASDAELPLGTAQHWMLREKGGHKGTQFALKSLWNTSRDLAHFLPLISVAHREYPWMLSLAYYRDLSLTVGLNVTKELSVNGSATIQNSEPRKNKQAAVQTSRFNKAWNDLAPGVEISKATLEVEYMKEGNIDSLLALSYRPVPEVDMSAGLTITKRLGRNFAVGASGVVLKSGNNLTTFGSLSVRQQLGGVIMAQAIDRHLNFRWSALYHNAAALKRSERMLKGLADDQEITDWSITPAFLLNLGLRSKFITISGGLSAENDSTQINITCATEKTPETNTSFSLGVSAMQKIQNLHVGIIYEAGAETPASTWWSRRTSRYGLRVTYNL